MSTAISFLKLSTNSCTHSPPPYHTPFVNQILPCPYFLIKHKQSHDWCRHRHNSGLMQLPLCMPLLQNHVLSLIPQSLSGSYRNQPVSSCNLLRLISPLPSLPFLQSYQY